MFSPHTVIVSSSPIGTPREGSLPSSSDSIKWLLATAAIAADPEKWEWLHALFEAAEAASVYRKAAIWCHENGIETLDALLLTREQFLAQSFVSRLLSVTRERIEGALEAAAKPRPQLRGAPRGAPPAGAATSSAATLAQAAAPPPAERGAPLSKEGASNSKLTTQQGSFASGGLPSRHGSFASLGEESTSSLLPTLPSRQASFALSEDSQSLGPPREESLTLPTLPSTAAAAPSELPSLPSQLSSLTFDSLSRRDSAAGCDDLVVSFATQQSEADSNSMYAQTLASADLAESSSGRGRGPFVPPQLARGSSELGALVSPGGPRGGGLGALGTSSTRLAAPGAARVLDTVDTTGDGIKDSVVLDINGNGLTDAVRKIEWRTGTRERMRMHKGGMVSQAEARQKMLRSGSALVDTTGDGKADTLALDTTGDGYVDTLRPMQPKADAPPTEHTAAARLQPRGSGEFVAEVPLSRGPSRSIDRSIPAVETRQLSPSLGLAETILPHAAKLGGRPPSKSTDIAYSARV